MTKVNLGGLALAALILAAVLTVEPLHRRRWLRWPAIARSIVIPAAPTGIFLALPLALSWVALLTPRGVPESEFGRFARVFLVILALAETLQAYPVAGSQVSIAAICFVAVGALCIADGIRALEAWAAGRGPEPLRRAIAIGSLATIPVAGLFAYDVVARPASASQTAYESQPPLPFPGAGLVHPAAAQVTEYTELVAMLNEYRCSALIGYPNVDSLYLWSGIEPPEPNPPGAWVTLFDRSQQARVLRALRTSPRALRDPQRVPRRIVARRPRATGGARSSPTSSTTSNPSVWSASSTRRAGGQRGPGAIVPRQELTVR